MFALADCNSFFASCELVFNPGLEKKPLVILSNNDGMIIARSSKAKEIGIKMGEPAYLYREMANRGDIHMLSSNFSLYADLSRRVMETLSSFSPDLEVYSIDEAFLILEESEEEALKEKSRAIRSKVKQWTGIPISIGAGPTKTLAKLANEKAKKEPDGVCLLASVSSIEEKLRSTSLEDIWGIGRKLAERLKKNGIYTAEQLARADDVWIRKLLGVTGFQTVLELRGIPCLELAEERGKKKSILCSRSFPSPIEDLSLLSEAISSFAVKTAASLRKQKSLASFLSVFIATSPFQEPFESRSCHIQLPNPVSYTPELIRHAKEGLAQIYRRGCKYKKGGVLLGDFCDEEGIQPDLIASPSDPSKKNEAMKWIDRINARYDKPAIRFAAQGIDETAWRSARARVSPKFTTSWNDLLKI